MLASTAAAAGQDAFFSRFYSSILYFNPAYAGTARIPRISAAYRNQMPALESPYVSYNASYDQPIELLQGGLGINISNDVQGQGTLNRMSVDAIYAYHLVVNPELVVSAGFQASYGLRFLNTAGMILPDPLTGTTGTYAGHNESLSDQRKGFPDFAVGFVAYNRNAYAGASMHHLTRPDFSLSGDQYQPLSRKLILHGGIFIPLYERRFGREALELNPNLIYIQQAGFRQLNYGMEGIYKGMSLGIWIRHGIDFQVNALSFHFGYEQSWFRMGYSYDFNMSDPWREMSNTGAHEASFLLKLDYKKGSRNNSRAIKCPRN